MIKHISLAIFDTRAMDLSLHRYEVFILRFGSIKQFGCVKKNLALSDFVSKWIQTHMTSHVGTGVSGWNDQCRSWGSRIHKLGHHGHWCENVTRFSTFCIRRLSSPSMTGISSTCWLQTPFSCNLHSNSGSNRFSQLFASQWYEKKVSHMYTFIEQFFLPFATRVGSAPPARQNRLRTAPGRSWALQQKWSNINNILSLAV